MGLLGREIGKEGGVVAQGFLQSLVTWLYNKIFATQIAEQQKQRQELLTELEQLKAEKSAKISQDQGQIDVAEKEKPAIVEQIKAEQQIQQKDEAQIQKVQDDLNKKTDADRRESDHDLVRDQF